MMDAPDEFMRISKRDNSHERQEAAATLAAIFSTGVALFVATWFSSVISSGWPQVGYWLGLVLLSWPTAFVFCALLASLYESIARMTSP